MKQALICVSFGTTVPAARRDIEAVEAALRAAAPGRQFARAYTSGMIRRTLAARGQAVDSLPEALARLRAGGCRDVIVQPTHFLCGVEYDKLKAEALAAAAGFWRLSAVTLSGFVLGLILGECFGPNPAGAALGMGHYGWLIWGAVFLLSAGAGAFAEIFCRRRQRLKQRSKKAKGS